MLTDDSQKMKETIKVSYTAIFLALTVLLLDQLTKIWTYRHIPAMEHFPYIYPYGGIGVFKSFLGIEFSLTHMTNKGAAWGMLGNYQISLIFLRLGLIIGTIIYLFGFNTHRVWQIPLFLIVAGAIGNVIDFFVYGHVIDMLHFVLWGYDFPIFNIADSAISIGILALIVLPRATSNL